MSGISQSIPKSINRSYVPITIWNQEQYLVANIPFKRQKKASDKHLNALTQKVLNVFQKLERAVNKSKSVTLDPTFCHQQLVALAKEGYLAYTRFFDKKVQRILARRLQKDVVCAPTFISDVAPFPWEVLYQGQDYKEGKPEMFWGLQYPLARFLEVYEDPLEYMIQQQPPVNMLFSYHHQLRHAHEKELPAIQKSVKISQGDCFHLLAAKGGLERISDGESLLEYLNESDHNMLHFACHCRANDDDSDSLLISLIDESTSRIIELETTHFELVDGSFQKKLLVFLNACQSSGGTDELRKAVNFPQMFYERGAVAIIATACPVPDIFAAEFARIFYSHFRRDHLPIGEALRRTRLYFLEEHNNPLGLAYGLYSPAHYWVAKSPVARRAASY